jgi:hypothetical protein
VVGGDIEVRLVIVSSWMRGRCIYIIGVGKVTKVWRNKKERKKKKKRK